MANESKDLPVLGHIDGLVKEEERLHAKGELADPDRDRLAKIKVAPRGLSAYLRDPNRILACYSGMPCWSAMQRLKSGRLTPSRAGVPSGAARRYCTGHERGTPNSFAMEWPVRLAQELAGEQDDIGFLFLNDGVGLSRGGYQADRAGEKAGLTANFFGERDLIAVTDWNLCSGRNPA